MHTWSSLTGPFQYNQDPCTGARMEHLDWPIQVQPGSLHSALCAVLYMEANAQTHLECCEHTPLVFLDVTLRSVTYEGQHSNIMDDHLRTLHHITQCYMLPNTTPHYAVLHHVTEYYTTLRSVTPCYRILHHITQCYTMLPNTTPHYAVLHHVTEYYTTLRSVTPCYRILHHITPCYAVLPAAYTYLFCNELEPLVFPHGLVGFTQDWVERFASSTIVRQGVGRHCKGCHSDLSYVGVRVCVGVSFVMCTCVYVRMGGGTNIHRSILGMQMA